MGRKGAAAQLQASLWIDESLPLKQWFTVVLRGNGQV